MDFIYSDQAGYERESKSRCGLDLMTSARPVIVVPVKIVLGILLEVKQSKSASVQTAKTRLA